MPIIRSFSTIRGTAAADSGLLTVTRTISEPARHNSETCFTVPAMSAVSVLVIDCTTTGWPAPSVTAPTLTARVIRRGAAPASMGNLQGAEKSFMAHILGPVARSR